MPLREPLLPYAEHFIRAMQCAVLFDDFECRVPGDCYGQACARGAIATPPSGPCAFGLDRKLLGCVLQPAQHAFSMAQQPVRAPRVETVT